MIAMSCSESLRRSHPYNMITLAAFTLCEAFLVSGLVPPGLAAAVRSGQSLLSACVAAEPDSL